VIAAVVASLVLGAGVCAALAVRASVRSRVREAMGAGPVRSETSVRGIIARFGRKAVGRGVLGLVAAGAAFSVGGPAAAVVIVGIGVSVPVVRRRRRRRRGAELLEEQLVAAVSGVAAALRAGLSLSQAIRFAASETEAPVSGELRAVAEREDLGLSLDASLDRWAESSSSGDIRLVANALRLRIGAGLPRVCDEVGRALRQRRTVVREVRSLTAQARLSGTILGVLPIGFFLFLSLTSRHDMAQAFGQPAGVAAIVVGLLLQLGGYLWIRRLVAVGTT
jgi:tight adherence protein B